ncbi:MAG: glycosyltransferase, partial [Desulfovibrio sp.]
MNIAFVNSTRKWGGVKTWTLESAAFLKEQGHGVHVIARPGPFADQASESGLSVWTMRFGIDFSPLRIIQCARFFQRNAIDLLVANVGKDMRIAGVAAKLAGVPVVHRVGLAGDLRDRPKIRWLHQWIKPHILVPCEFIKQGLLEKLPYLHAHE